MKKLKCFFAFLYLVPGLAMASVSIPTDRDLLGSNATKDWGVLEFINFLMATFCALVTGFLIVVIVVQTIKGAIQKQKDIEFNKATMSDMFLYIAAGAGLLVITAVIGGWITSMWI